MTNEEKQLLLKDLCGRLPYNNTMIRVEVLDENRAIIRKTQDDTLCTMWVDIVAADNPYHVIKPYLRSMSSMTEEERKYISDRCGFSISGPIRNECELIMPVLAADWLIDFYNEHHIDYHGLIPMGLALEAPEGMYKI